MQKHKKATHSPRISSRKSNSRGTAPSGFLVTLQRMTTRPTPDQRYRKGDSAISQSVNSHSILDKYAKIQVEQKMASLQRPLETGYSYEED